MPRTRFAYCKRQTNPVGGSDDLCLMRKTGTLDAGRRCVRSAPTGFPDNGDGPTDERTTIHTQVKMKSEKGQGAHNDNGQATVETGSTTTAQAAPVQATPTEAVRDLKAEAEQAADAAITEPILRSFTTNVLATADVKKAHDGKAIIKAVNAKLIEHVDAAIAALEAANIKGPRLSRIMHGDFVKVLEGAGWASAKDMIGRRCTHYGHRVRAPKEGEADRQAIAKRVKEETAAAKAMATGSVSDQVARFRAYWQAATDEQKAAIRAVVNADVMEPATV